MHKFLLGLSFLMCGCTDAVISHFTTFGSSAEVKIYSGGKVIFWGESTGKVSNENQSDGYFAKWKIKAIEGHWENVKVGDVRAASVSNNIIMIYEN